MLFRTGYIRHHKSYGGLFEQASEASVRPACSRSV